MSRFIMFLVFMLFVCVSYAQEEEEVAGDFLVNNIEFTINPTFPIGSFSDNIGDKNLTGFSLSYLRQRDIESSYSFVGGQIEYLRLGSDFSNAFIGSPTSSALNTTSNIINALAQYRYYFSVYFGALEPFIEAKLGPQFLFSETTETFFENGQSFESNNLDEFDLGLAYGVGLGFSYAIYEGLLISFKTNIMSGTASTYLVENNSELPNTIDNFNRVTSTVTYLNLQLGVGYIFE